SSAPPPPPKREQGRVATLREQFGFIQCCDRPGDLFFHLSVAPDGISIGDEVEFVVGHSDRSTRECASDVAVLPPGTIRFEAEIPGVFRGVVDRDLRAAQYGGGINRRNDRQGGRGRPVGRGDDGADGVIKVRQWSLSFIWQNLSVIKGQKPITDGRAGIREKGRTGYRIAIALLTHFLGQEALLNFDEPLLLALLGVVLRFLVQVSGPALSKDAATAVEGEAAAPEAVAAAAFAGEMAAFGPTSLADQSASLRRGDEVEFRLVQHKGSGRKRAADVRVVRSSRQRQDEEQERALREAGAQRERGIVVRINGDYGFIRGADREEHLYFNVATARAGPPPRLREGADVEFWVVDDTAKDGRPSLRALGVVVLPRGSV
ncbi:unnamed protein product, partial [Phaeothamnion confervicola]